MGIWVSSIGISSISSSIWESIDISVSLWLGISRSLSVSIDTMGIWVSSIGISSISSSIWVSISGISGISMSIWVSSIGSVKEGWISLGLGLSLWLGKCESSTADHKSKLEHVVYL